MRENMNAFRAISSDCKFLTLYQHVSGSRLNMGRRAKTKQNDPVPLPESASTAEPSSKRLGKRKLNQAVDSVQAHKKQRTKAKASKSLKRLAKSTTEAGESSESAWEDVGDNEAVLPGATA